MCFVGANFDVLNHVEMHCWKKLHEMWAGYPGQKTNEISMAFGSVWNHSHIRLFSTTCWYWFLTDAPGKKSKQLICTLKRKTGRWNWTGKRSLKLPSSEKRYVAVNLRFLGIFHKSKSVLYDTITFNWYTATLSYSETTISLGIWVIMTEPKRLHPSFELIDVLWIVPVWNFHVSCHLLEARLSGIFTYGSTVWNCSLEWDGKFIVPHDYKHVFHKIWS